LSVARHFSSLRLSQKELGGSLFETLFFLGNPILDSLDMPMDREIYEKVISGNIQDISDLRGKGAGIEVTKISSFSFPPSFLAPSKRTEKHGLIIRSFSLVLMRYIFPIFFRCCIRFSS
jgi:hypothetical protein